MEMTSCFVQKLLFCLSKMQQRKKKDKLNVVVMERYYADLG